MLKKIIILIIILSFVSSIGLNAISLKAAMTFVKTVAKELGIKIAERTGKYAGKIVELSKRFGDDLVKRAFKRIGPKAVTIAEKYGDDGLRIISKYGDDAVRVIETGGGKTAVKLFKRYGNKVVTVAERAPGSGTYALEKLGGRVTELSGKNILRASGYFKDAARKGFGTSFKTNFKKYGGKFIKFIGRHKGILGAAAIYGAVKLNPDGELIPGLPNKKPGRIVSKALDFIPKTLDFTFYAIIGFIAIFFLIIIRLLNRIINMKYKKLENEAITDEKKNQIKEFETEEKEEKQTKINKND